MKRSVYNKNNNPLGNNVNGWAGIISAGLGVANLLLGGGGPSTGGMDANAQAQSQIAQNLYKDWSSTFRPLSTAIGSQYGITPSSPADAQAAANVNAATQQKIQQQQAMAQAGAAQSTDAATEAANRKMMAFGVNPNDARFAGANRASALGGAVAAINAENQVPQQVQQQEMSFMNLGSPLIGQSVGSFSSANAGYGAEASIQQQQYANQQQTLANFGAGLGSAQGNKPFGSGFMSWWNGSGGSNTPITAGTPNFDGGYINAPPGPSDKDTGHINIKNGEYVLPSETVKAMGGAEMLNDLVERTTGVRPARKTAIPGTVSGLRGFVEGGGASTPTTFSNLLSRFFSPVVPENTQQREPANYNLFDQSATGGVPIPITFPNLSPVAPENTQPGEPTNYNLFGESPIGGVPILNPNSGYNRYTGMTGILPKSGLDRAVPPMNYDPTNGNLYTYPNIAIRPDTFRNAPKNEPQLPVAPAGGRPPGVTKGKDDPYGTPTIVPEDRGKTEPTSPNTAAAAQSPPATPYSKYTEQLMKSLFEPTQRPQDSSVMGSLGSALLNGLTAGGYLQGKQIAFQNARDLKTQDYQNTLQNIQKMNMIGTSEAQQLAAQMRSEIQAAMAAAGKDPDNQAKAAALVGLRYGGTNALNGYSGLVNAMSPNIMPLVPGTGLNEDGYPTITNPEQFKLWGSVIHPLNPLAALYGGSGGSGPPGQYQVGDQSPNSGTKLYLPEIN